MSAAQNITCPTCEGKGELARADATFGLLVAIRRKELNLTQDELAKRIGMSRASIANIESNRTETTLGNVRAFASALELPLEDLIP